MIGKIAIYISLFLSIATALYFFLSEKKGLSTAKTANMMYYVLTGLILFASMFLLSNILAHNFQYTYIWEYSSRELSDPLLIASFYSGQQGSFLLWVLIIAILGLFLAPAMRKLGYESISMGFYTLIITFFLILLVVKSPFAFVWETFADQGIQPGFMPENGRGLNPLLQNYWITIHPPILFTGYSAMALPFVIALAGLVKREHNKWVKVAMPWTLLGSAILGLGIMLGGFWAYETLGWGGFWGWDPVENSSLLPWLTSVALIHTMIIQKTTGGLGKTNYVLAIITFVLVLYATYLTRSGILSDVSVHSFVAPGFWVHRLLEIFMGVFIIFGLGYFFLRLKDINSKTNTKQLKYASKEFFLSLGNIVILAITIIVFIGTSLPWMSKIFGATAGAVEPETYNVWILPFAVLILFLNATSLYMKWGASKFGDLAKKIMLPFIFAIVATIVSVLLGVQKISFIFLIFSGFFSLYANIEFFVKAVSKKPSLTGAYISHFGLSLLLIGALLSGGYSQSKAVQLYEGDSQVALGYNFSFNGKERVQEYYKDREKYEYLIGVETANSKSVVRPVVYWSEFNDWSSPFLEPGIKILATKDIYVAPRSIETKFDVPMNMLSKGEKSPIPIDSSISIELVQFDMSQGMREVHGQDIVIGAIAAFDVNGTIHTDTLLCILNVETWQGSPIFYTIPDTDIQAGFMQLIRNEQDIALTEAVIIYKKVGEPNPKPIEIFTFEVSIKPYINLVWLGTIGMVVGFFIAIGKHRNERKLRDKLIKQKTNGSGNGNKPTAKTEHPIANSEQATTDS